MLSRLNPKGECGSQPHVEIQVAVYQADLLSDGAGPVLSDQYGWQVFDIRVTARGIGPKLLEQEAKSGKMVNAQL